MGGHYRAVGLAVGLGLALVAVGTAQEKQDTPPTQAKELLPSGIRGYVVADKRYPIKDDRNRTGKIHDFVVEYGLNPGVMVISRVVPNTADNPLIPLLKKLQELSAVPKNRAANLATFSVFAYLPRPFAEEETREQFIAQVAKVGEVANLPGVPLVLTESDADSLKQFGIAPEDEITVIAYTRLAVARRWKFSANNPPKAEDLEEITRTVDAIVPSVGRVRRTKPADK